MAAFTWVDSILVIFNEISSPKRPFHGCRPCATFREIEYTGEFYIFAGCVRGFALLFDF